MEARALLCAEADALTDDQVLQLVAQADAVAFVIVETLLDPETSL